jgi:two-component system response regulator PilR (NtrC family)
LLDEISEMTPSMQVKLLRVLQEKKVRSVGGAQEEPVDVRIVAATNQDLLQLTETGEFREDLYYRINVIPIRLPPLRRRRDDIPLLVDFFIKKFSESMGIEPKKISVEAMRTLEGYHWPGNVRELENLIERALALSTAEVVTLEDLPAVMMQPQPGPGELLSLPEEGLSLEIYLDDIRKQLMTEALERTHGVQTQAADLLGMSFRSFRYYAKKMGLTGVETEDVDEASTSL